MQKAENNRLLIVGNQEPIHIGAHLLRAAQDRGLPVEFHNISAAFNAPWPIVKFNWWLRGHRPPWLDRFSRQIIDVCQRFRPRWVLTTGISPIEDRALKAIGQLGVQRLNFLTDDPWNPAHKAPWFMRALPHYDCVFSPRRANLADLRGLGCSGVSYLPFAYAPELHFAEPPITVAEQERFAADVVFAGGADSDRVDYLAALIRAGFKVALYGGYWTRFPETKAYSRGQVGPQILRKAIGGAKVALCLVRRANRDGHSMRTFEVPAIGACMLVENTEEHREIFGKELQAVAYFSDIDEMIEKLKWLLRCDGERQRLSRSSHQLITQGNHTYGDRLISMLSLADAELASVRNAVTRCLTRIQ